MKRASMDRFIDTIEWIAAGFVGIVAANIFIAVLLRNTLQLFDPGFLRYRAHAARHSDLLGHRRHQLSRRPHHRRSDLGQCRSEIPALIDVFATLVLLFVVTVQTWTLFDKVRGTYNDNVLTFDMHMPTWPFFAVAWAGDVSAVLLIAIRTYRLIFHPEEMHDPKIKATE